MSEQNEKRSHWEANFIASRPMGKSFAAVRSFARISNSPHTGLPEEMWLAAHFFLQNDDGEIVGGALGNIWGDWYFLDILWVDRPLRGQDNGQRMLAAAEQHAIERGCTGAHLDTASFQARPFYEKLGYAVFGTLEDHPVGHTHYLLRKRLRTS